MNNSNKSPSKRCNAEQMAGSLRTMDKVVAVVIAEDDEVEMVLVDKDNNNIVKVVVSEAYAGRILGRHKKYCEAFNGGIITDLNQFRKPSRWTRIRAWLRTRTI